MTGLQQGHWNWTHKEETWEQTAVCRALDKEEKEWEAIQRLLKQLPERKHPYLRSCKNSGHSLPEWSPPNCMFGVLLSVVDSCLVSFLLNVIFVRMQYRKNADAVLETSVIPEGLPGAGEGTAASGARTVYQLDLSSIHLIVVACDAGMGSSQIRRIITGACFSKRISA